MKRFALLIAGIAGLSSATRAQPVPFTELFCPVDTAWTGDTIVVPPAPLRYNILLREGDIAHNLDNNNSAPVKGGFGTVYYNETSSAPGAPIGTMNFNQSTEGWLYLSLLDNKAGVTGDGGGLLRMKIKRDASGDWGVQQQTDGGTNYNYRFFDMGGLGGSINNNGLHWGFSGGTTNGTGNLFMYDGWTGSNAAISPGISDLSNYTLPAGSPQPGLSIPRYQNMGWLLEVSRSTGMPLRKLYHAGRGDFGGILASSKMYAGFPEAKDIVIIYATQTQPAVLLKYEGNDGKISAFKQDAGAYTGQWVLLNELDVDGSIFPFSFAELLDVQKLALEKGATMFNRLGGIVGTRDNFIIAETGGNSTGNAFTDPATAYNGGLAYHLALRDADNDGKFQDPYGRLLRFTTNGTIEIKPYLEGGRTMDWRYTFSNPKQLSSVGFSYNTGGASGTGVGYLIINEEVPDKDYHRNPATAITPDKLMQEIYFLDVTKTAPDLSDLRPFAIIPRGAEIQSAFSVRTKWSPLFLSLRYPNPANDSPFHKSLVIAVSDFEQYFAAPAACGWVVPPPGSDTSVTAVGDLHYNHPDDFMVWPNPARRTLHLNKAQDIELYDINGRLVKRRKQVTEIDIFDLRAGIYLIRNAKGQSKKIIIQ